MMNILPFVYVDPNVAALLRHVRRLTAELAADRESRQESDEALRVLTERIRRLDPPGGSA